MKSYTTNTPVFRDTIKITEKNDRAHADIINEAPIQTFQNTLCNRQSIEQLKQSAVSTKDYDPEVSYQVGDNCLYQNTLYKCVQETTGEWNPDCWKKTNILEEMKNLEKGVLYPEFDDSGEVEGITSFTDFLDSVVSKIPLVKFLRNFKAGMKFVLHAGQLVTDCVTDRDDLPVAACTVKNLMDLYTQLNSDFSTTKAISLTPNPDWIKSDAGKVLCFKIADRYIFQFTEVIFLKDGHVDFADTVLWTLGENTSSGHVFVLRPISDKTDNYFHTVRLYCYNDKIYGHYSNIYKDIEYFGLLVI